MPPSKLLPFRPQGAIAQHILAAVVSTEASVTIFAPIMVATRVDY